MIINEGGTGSSKTFSLAQLFAVILANEENTQITIARKTFPALRATAMKDFFRVLRELGMYREEDHNKSENIYKYKTNEVDFISIDEPMKVRSRRRQYLWLNEANEFALEDYRQLSMRTDKQIYMDYNPSHQYHWIYDELQPRKDCIVIQSTYKDNPFLPLELVKEIEGYKTKDKNYWRVYGLGLKGISETTIYTHWQFCDSFPEAPEKLFYGLDFGYNNPTALVKIAEKDKDFYWEEQIYERYMTNVDLIERMKTLGIPKNVRIYADPAEPARIEEIRRAGYDCVGAKKGEIKDGIDKIKSRGFYITKGSVNLLREVKSYSWKEKDGKPLEEPVRENDHLLDAGRYGVISELGGAKPYFTKIDEPEKSIYIPPVPTKPPLSEIKPANMTQQQIRDKIMEEEKAMIKREEIRRMYGY